MSDLVVKAGFMLQKRHSETELPELGYPTSRYQAASRVISNFLVGPVSINIKRVRMPLALDTTTLKLDGFYLNIPKRVMVSTRKCDY